MNMRLEDLLSQNLSNKLEEVRRRAEPLLEKIVEVFPDYTIHNINHSDKVLRILKWLVPDELKKAMNEWEVFFLACAAVLHDCGMAKFSETEKVEKSEIRRRHHIRSEEYINEHWPELGFDDRHQASLVGLLCRGHRESPSTYRERYTPDSKYRTGAYINNINVPLLSMFLQIADALDLDFERAPLDYYERIYPDLEPIGQQEWKRHMGTSGAGPAPYAHRIDVDVRECKSPQILHACRLLIKDIQTLLTELPNHLYHYSEYGKYIVPYIRLIEPEVMEIGLETPREAPQLFVIKSLNDFHKFVTDTHGFVERPFKEKEEWISKREQLFYFGEEEEIERKFENTLARLASTRISLITGEPNSGKSTFLMFFVEECLKKNIYRLILFLNPFIEAEALASNEGIGVLDNIEKLIATQFRQYDRSKVLIAIDALKREETDSNFVEKCDRLFSYVFDHKYSLIATVRSDQRDLLKRYFGKMPIEKWIKYRIEKGQIEIKPDLDFEHVKNTVTRYLNFKLYQEIRPEFSLDSAEFNECVKAIGRKSRGVIGDIAFIIEDIAISSQKFSKETIERYPEGIVGIPSGYLLRWNTIRRDYSIEGDKVLPAAFLILTYQNYSITKAFIDEFVEWGIEELDRGLVDGKRISTRIENLLTYYCVPTQFEEANQFRLRSDWREAIEEGLSDQKIFQNLNVVNDFRYIVNTKRLVNWVVRFIFKLRDDLESDKLPHWNIRTWYIVGDMAKAWGMNIPGKELEVRLKSEILESTSNFLTNTLRTHPKVWHFGIPWNFLRKTFSLIWRRALNDVTLQHCDAAIEFFKYLRSLDPEDFWSSWMLGEFQERRGEYDKALESYVESASIQNTSKGYGSLIDRLRSRKDILPDYIQIEYLALREKIAMKAIECYAGNHRNWGDLAEASTYKGDIFVKKEKYRRAIENLDNSVKAYERGMEVIEKLTARQHRKDEARFQKGIVVALWKRAYANAHIGRLEDSARDMKTAVEIEKLSGVKEDIVENRKWLFIYNERLVCRDFITQVFNFIINITNSAIRGEKAQRLSNAWYNIKTLLDDLDPKYIGGDLRDLKISALHHSLRLNPANEVAEQDLRELTGGAFPRIEETRYTARYHENYAESIKNQKQVLEVFHRSFSALIHTMRFSYHLRRGDIVLENEERKILSWRWGILGKRISNDFVSMIPNKIVMKCFEFSVFFRPDNLDSWYNLGWQCLFEGRFDKALEAFSENLKLEEEKGRRKYSHLSKIGIGKMHEERGDAISAADWFKEGAKLCIEMYAKEDPPRGVELLTKTADSLRDLSLLDIPVDKKTEFIKDAIETHRKAIEISASANLDDVQTLLQNKVRLLEKQVAWMLGKKLQPVMHLDEILEAPLVTLLSAKSEPERLETLYKKESAFSKLGENEKSVEYANKILELQPYNIFARINKANNLGNLGRYKEALDEINKVFDMDPEKGTSLSFAWHNKGFYLYKLGRLSEAIRCYDESLKLDPDYAPACYNKGYALHKMRDYEQAIGCYDRALELEPENEVTWENKGWSLFRLLRYEDSILCYDKALEINPRSVKAWNGKGQALGKIRGRLEEALMCLDEALTLASEAKLDELDPEYAAAIFDNKGYVLNELQRYGEAIDYFDEALRLDPKYTSAWLNKIYANLHVSLENGFRKGFLVESAVIAEAALSKVENEADFIKKVNRLTISWVKNSILECFLDSRDKLQFLLDEFKETFGKFNARTPLLKEIKAKCMQSEKYEESKEKIKRIFNNH